jgi:four helix bundle protein
MDKKPYDLEERTLEFAKGIINLCQKMPKNTINFKLIEQLIDASSSVGANYREANDKLSKKDFILRMKIARKECKESTYWLELLKEANPDFKEEINDFIKESQELRNIFTSIINKSE